MMPQQISMFGSRMVQESLFVVAPVRRPQQVLKAAGPRTWTVATAKAAILALLAHGGLTDEAIGAGLDMPANTVRPRRGELVRAGLVCAVGTTRNARGLPVNLWGLAQ